MRHEPAFSAWFACVENGKLEKLSAGFGPSFLADFRSWLANPGRRGEVRVGIPTVLDRERRPDHGMDHMDSIDGPRARRRLVGSSTV